MRLAGGAGEGNGDEGLEDEELESEGPEGKTTGVVSSGPFADLAFLSLAGSTSLFAGGFVAAD